MRIIKNWKFFICFIGLLRLGLPHVVFEEFGTLAGSVSYMHVTLHINLSHVDNLIQTYIRQATELKENIVQVFDVTIKNTTYDGTKEWFESEKQVVLSVIDTFIEAAEGEELTIRNLQNVLPLDQQYNPNRPMYRDSRSIKSKAAQGLVSKGAQEILDVLQKKGLHLPNKKTGGKYFKIARTGLRAAKILKGISPLSMGFSLVKGIFGTFMGLYNVFQMEKLRRELRGVIQTQNRVIEVLADHQAQLLDLKDELDDIKSQFAVQQAIKSSVIAAQLTRGLSTLKSATQQAIHAVQQAHHHRLAIDYLDPDTLDFLYNTLSQQASDSKYKLLTRFPSDLFQLELSYMFDGEDVVLFLHVPMVPIDSLLTLYRLKPFPIPFSDTMALLPKPSSSLLALSNSIPRAMTNIEHADLVDCHQVNQVYLCERHGVLQNNIKASCLGALFEQDIPTAQQICDLELVPYQEAVLQLKNNWFLIYSPVMFTAYVLCFNSTSAAKPIKVGVNEVFVDPSCRLDLNNHTLTSDLSMKLDAEVTYFPWQVADLSAFGVNEEDIKAAMMLRTTAGERNIYLADVIQNKHFSSAYPKWQWVMAALIFTALVALVIFVFLSIGTHRLFRFRRRMRRIRNAVDQIRHIPGMRPPSRRNSQRLNEEVDENLPPMYPGLPQEEQEYELMNLNPVQMSRNLQRLSRSVSRMSERIRSVSAPDSRRSSRLSFFRSRNDSDAEDFASSKDRSLGPTPTPMLRTKTPSYAFLRATATDDQPALPQ